MDIESTASAQISPSPPGRPRSIAKRGQTLRICSIARFERALEEIDHRRGTLLAKRDRLMERMDTFGDLC